MQNKKLSLCLQAICLINGTSFTFIIPILPDFLIKKQVSIATIGIILSVYQISNLIASLYLSKKSGVYRKTMLISIGQSNLVITVFFYGILQYFSDENFIVFLAAFLRFCQGISYPLVNSTIYSIVPMLNPEETEKNYAYFLMCSGLGVALGPVIGGFAYNFLGLASYYVFSVVYAAEGLIILPFVLKSVDFLEKQEKAAKSQKSTGGNPRKIQLKKAISNRDFLLTAFIFIVALMSYPAIQPGFSNHVHSYGGNDETVGLIFGSGDLVYVLTGFFVIHLLEKSKIQKKFFFIYGALITIVGLLAMGPEKYTYLPENLWMVTLGVSLMGFSQMLYLPIVIPQFIEIFNEIDGDAVGNNELAATLFTASLSATFFCGFIVGGVLIDNFGFSRGMTIYAMISLACTLIYARFYSKKQGICVRNECEMKLIDNCNNLLIENDNNIGIHNDNSNNNHNNAN